MLAGLVVDPVPLSRPLLKTALSNCSVSWAQTGDQGLNQVTTRLLQENPFDFILLDTAVNRPSVPRFIAELHKLEATFQVTRGSAVILMSSSGRLTVRADPLMPQLHGFLCRPFQRYDLERCLEQAGLLVGNASAAEPEETMVTHAQEKDHHDANADESSGELVVSTS